MRSQTNYRNIAKLEPTTDRGSERWRSHFCSSAHCP
jgi:hypothetical protein